MAARRRPRHEAQRLSHVFYSLGAQRPDNTLHNVDEVVVTPNLALAILGHLLRSLALHDDDSFLPVETVAQLLSDVAAAFLPQSPNVQVAAALIAAARITTDAHGEAETRGREIARDLRGDGDGDARTAADHLVAIGDVLGDE